MVSRSVFDPQQLLRFRDGYLGPTGPWKMSHRSCGISGGDARSCFQAGVVCHRSSRSHRPLRKRSCPSAPTSALKRSRASWKKCLSRHSKSLEWSEAPELGARARPILRIGSDLAPGGQVEDVMDHPMFGHVFNCQLTNWYSMIFNYNQIIVKHIIIYCLMCFWWDGVSSFLTGRSCGRLFSHVLSSLGHPCAGPGHKTGPSLCIWILSPMEKTWKHPPKRWS